MAPIRLDQVNLVVRDVEASRAFYARLGLDFGDERDPVWSAHHVSARHGDEHATRRRPGQHDLRSRSGTRAGPGGSGAVLGFKVDTRAEVDALVAALAAEGVPVQQDPYDAFWGARYAVVSDPDGNAVGIMSPVDRGLPPPATVAFVSAPPPTRRSTWWSRSPPAAATSTSTTTRGT